MMNVLKNIFGRAGKSDERQEGEVAAAIAAALELYGGNGVHDKESYIITIRRR